MSGAAKSNVLMFLAAMCAVGTVWLAVVAVTGPNILYAVMAVLLAVATVIAWRTYRRVLRELDAEERRT
jgi:Flp pilus assembly protein TadB